jgi:phytoene desaturase
VAERVDVAVIGAGVGGLATAIRLGAAGHRVVVVERRPVTGGKMATQRHAGFTFDVGPSLLTLPMLLDDLVRVAGTTLHDELDLVRLDPQFQYRWPDGSSLTIPDAPEERAAAFEQFSSGAGEQWRRFDARGRRIWDVSQRTFLAGPMDGPGRLLRRMHSPGDLMSIDPLRTLHGRAARTFSDPRLVQWAGRYATYSGSSPFRAPATLACIAHLEARYGCWYPRGGLDAVRSMLERLAIRCGVDVRCGADVARITVDGTRVDGVELADGTAVKAAAVAANADAEHVYRDLVADDGELRRARRAERSMSGLIVLAAARGRTPGVGHHTVWFAPDDHAEFAALAHGRMADDPTIYACVSAATDPTQAPPGHENWSLLVNAPPGIELDAETERDRILAVLAQRGIDLRHRLLWSAVITPLDQAARWRAPGGAIYGASSNGRRAAFLRPPNRSRRAGLYLVGGSSHPGGGLPLVLTSGRIVADLVATQLADVGR